MKIALLADLHFGIHKSLISFLNSQKKFLYEQFIPYIKENKINECMILGDIFDTRNSVNVRIIDEAYNFIDELSKLCHVYIIVGNHDMYFKNDVSIHSTKVFEKFDNVSIVDKNTEAEFDNKKFLLSPWQVDFDDFTDFIKNKEYDACMGHFDINGAKMNINRKSDCGLNKSIFANIKKVFSGHFHLRDTMKAKGTEFIYIGSAFSFDRHDIDAQKGFCILDTQDLSHDFIDNEKSIKYLKIDYPNIPEKKTVENNVIDVYIKYNEDYDSVKFQEYIKKIDDLQPLEVNTKIINNFLSGSEIENLEDYKASNIESLLREYTDNLQVKNKAEINKLIMDLFSKVKES